MKTSTAYLLKHLSKLAPVVPSNPIIPILENFKFDGDGTTLEITASDMQTTVTVSMPCEYKVEICMPAKQLMDTLKQLEDAPIEFDIDPETKAIQLIASTGTYKFIGEHIDSFPKTPTAGSDTTTIAQLDAIELASMISRSMPTISRDELRPAMSAFYLNAYDGKLRSITTNGHALTLIEPNRASYVNADLLIPSKAANVLKSAIVNGNFDVEVYADNRNAFFSFQSCTIAIRMVDDRYPDWQAAMPTEQPYELTIHRQNLINTLKRVQLYSNKATKNVRLAITETEVVVDGNDLDFNSEAREALVCEYEGEPLEIGFNSQFLIDGLSVMEGNLVKIGFSAARHPALLKGDGITVLIMPVLLNV